MRKLAPHHWSPDTALASPRMYAPGHQRALVSGMTLEHVHRCNRRRLERDGQRVVSNLLEFCVGYVLDHWPWCAEATGTGIKPLGNSGSAPALEHQNFGDWIARAAIRDKCSIVRARRGPAWAQGCAAPPSPPGRMAPSMARSCSVCGPAPHAARAAARFHPAESGCRHCTKITWRENQPAGRSRCVTFNGHGARAISSSADCIADPAGAKPRGKPS